MRGMELVGELTETRLLRGIINDAASERSEQGRFLGKGPDSSNAVLDRRAR